MGKCLIIKGADFHVNAINVESLLLQQAEPNRRYTVLTLTNLFPLLTAQELLRGKVITKVEISFLNTGQFSILKGRNIGTENWTSEIIETFNVVKGLNTLVFSTPFILGNDEWLGICASATECSSCQPMLYLSGKNKLEFWYSGSEGGTGTGYSGLSGDNLAFNVYGY